jgi:membrane protein
MPSTKEKFHFIHSWGPLFRSSFQEWVNDHATRFSAALAYYAIFAMAPLLIIAISVAGLVFGAEAARGQIYDQLHSLLGSEGAAEVQRLIKASSNPSHGIIGASTGVLALLLGASGVFAQLKDALNSIWGVELKPGGGIKTMLGDYLLNFSMVLSIGFLLIVSLVVSAALQAIKTFLTGALPIPGFVLPMAAAGTFLLLVLLFALLYKALPNVTIGWRDVWIGAVVTSILFTIGKYLVGLYLGRSGVGSSFGAAGALILILVWVYYSAMIFFLGAEFTKVYADCHGSGIHPGKNARLVSPTVRAKDESRNDGNRNARYSSNETPDEDGPIQ